MCNQLMILPFEGNDHSNSVLRLYGFAGDDYLSKLCEKIYKLRENAEENNQFVPDDFCSHLSFVDNDDDKDCYYGITNGLIYVFAKDLVELENIHKEYYKETDFFYIVWVIFF